MKNSILEQSNPKDNMLLAALKKTIANTPIAISQTKQTGTTAGTKQTYPSTQTNASLLRLNQMERMSDAAGTAPLVSVKNKTDAEIAKALPSDFPVDQWESMTARAQQKIISKTDLTKQEQWRLLNMPPSQLKNLAGQEETNDSYANRINAILMRGGDFDGSDAETLKDEQNALRSISDARTKQITNAFSNADAATLRDEQNTLKIVNEGNQALDDILTSIHLDLSNMSAEQKVFVTAARINIANRALLGNSAVDDIINYTANAIATRTTPPLGTTHVRILRLEEAEQMMPALGSIQTDVLSEADSKMILAIGQQHSDDPDKEEAYDKIRSYQEQVYQEEVEKYNEDLRNGTAKAGDYREYYDRAVLKFYENYAKPIPVKNNKGVVTGSVMLGELIDPNDNTLKAQAAMNALEMLGLDHEGLDCQGLVKLGYSQIDPMLGKHGIGNNAQYQRNRTSEKTVWSNNENTSKPKTSEMQTGDLLYWENEQGETVHTAIYLGGGYMVEWSGTVRVTPLRMHTSHGDGSGSDLVQVNRPTEEILYGNVEKNTKNY